MNTSHHSNTNLPHTQSPFNTTTRGDYSRIGAADETKGAWHHALAGHRAEEVEPTLGIATLRGARFLDRLPTRAPTTPSIRLCTNIAYVNTTYTRWELEAVHMRGDKTPQPCRSPTRPPRPHCRCGSPAACTKNAGSTSQSLQCTSPKRSTSPSWQ